MFLRSIFLAFCSSIDSIGIGISYGFKNIRISFLSYIILFWVSLFISSISIIIGSIFSSLLPIILSESIGSIILFLMGLYIIYKSLAEYNADFDKSNNIDIKEALFLGIALSVDSIGIGIGGVNIGVNIYLYSIFVSLFNIIFLTIGRLLGNKITSISNVPISSWSILSGGLLIFISILNLLFS